MAGEIADMGCIGCLVLVLIFIAIVVFLCVVPA